MDNNDRDSLGLQLPDFGDADVRGRRGGGGGPGDGRGGRRAGPAHGLLLPLELPHRVGQLQLKGVPLFQQLEERMWLATYNSIKKVLTLSYLGNLQG